MSKIVGKYESPTISTDSNSNESKLARQIKAMELQANEDSKFDLKVERFSNFNTTTLNLTSLLVAGSFLLALKVIAKK